MPTAKLTVGCNRSKTVKDAGETLAYMQSTPDGSCLLQDQYLPEHKPKDEMEAMKLHYNFGDAHPPKLLIS